MRKKQSTFRHANKTRALRVLRFEGGKLPHENRYILRDSKGAQPLWLGPGQSPGGVWGGAPRKKKRGVWRPKADIVRARAGRMEAEGRHSLCYTICATLGRLSFLRFDMPLLFVFLGDLFLGHDRYAQTSHS